MTTIPMETLRNAMAPIQALGPILSRSGRSKNTTVSCTSDGLAYHEKVILPHRYSKPRVDSIPIIEIMNALYGDSFNHKVPTLEALAIREIFKNVEFITPELLEELPWVIGRRVWYAAQSCGNGTLSLWRVFAPRYHEQDLFSYFRVSQFRPERTVQEHFGDITSPALHWLTCLTLSLPELPLEDIMAVSNISNLIALDICGLKLGLKESTSTYLVNDSVIRNWGRRAQECENCFTQLRVLILRNQVHVTEKVFSCLDMFPSLVILGVQGCTITHEIEPLAARHGWTCADETGLLKRMQRDIDHCYTWDGAIRSCVELSEDLVTTEAIAGLPTSKPPLLNYKLGITSNDVLVSTPLLLFRNLKAYSTSSRLEKPRRAASPISEASSSFFSTKAGHGPTASAIAASTTPASSIFLSSNRTETPIVPISSLSTLSSPSHGGNTSPCPSSTGEDDRSSARSASKRRKVRETKMVDLNDWFDSVNSNPGDGGGGGGGANNNSEGGKEKMKPAGELRNQTRSH